MNESKRTGLIAKKIGVSQIFDESGQTFAVTLLQTAGNVVVDTKTKENNGYNSVVLAFDEIKPNKLTQDLKGKYAKAKVATRRKMKEFRVSESGMLKVGEELAVDHFVAGQALDIQGTSTGKGFAGVMKRHNFRGLEASHGVSVSHRSHGSTGQRQDPGKVFKGKKMAGHMGDVTVTIQNVKVARVDEELGLIAVAGSVPGKRGTYVYLSDAIKISLPSNAKFPASLIEKKSAKVEAPNEEVKNEASNAEVTAEAKE